jgi:hypothetical protein
MDNDNCRSRPGSSFRKSNSWLIASGAGLLAWSFVMPADAALDSRTQNSVVVAVYDTDLGVTWLADANLAASNTFGVSGITTGTFAGRMAWDTAQSWITAMNTANYLGYNDWRLPTTQQPDASCSLSMANATGNNCIGSEMGHLFYSELSGTVGSFILSSGDPDLSKFQNIKPGYYWSTDYTPSTATTDAYEFNFNAGDQVGGFKGSSNNVWAVRTGDVVVPLPATVWLLGSGLFGMFGLSWKNRADAKPTG